MAPPTAETDKYLEERGKHPPVRCNCARKMRLTIVAAATALTSSSGRSHHDSRDILDENGKLSSASAATSLKYAKPQDLPSFPSTGLSLSSAGAAASLAASNPKSVELWKAGQIPNANKAALLAKDYEAKPLWKPEASSAGANAALLAHKDGLLKAANKKAQEDEDAALRRVAQSNIDRSREVDPDVHEKALMAATASVSRKRGGSTPQKPAALPTSAADSAWALKAATQSHSAGVPHTDDFAPGDPGFEAARIQNMSKQNMNRQMYTAAPPVAIEVQEKQRQDMLRASAVAMARQMFAVQQKQIDEASRAAKADGRTAAGRVRDSTVTGSSGSAGDEMMYPGNLEEAARKLAQERLSKIHDEHAEYRQYYGQTPPQRSRLSMRLNRRRASSSAGADDSDEESSRRIKSQMSIFQSKLAEVDNKKRQQDRDSLLQLAHRNVDAQMRSMDDKVFQETGKASPAQMEVWEKAAREKAQRESDERMQNVGKVHIGGGKYLDQAEVEAIARARLQPTLDDITRKAEEQRARDEELRLEREREAEARAAVRAAAGKQTPVLSSLVRVTDLFSLEKERAEQKAKEREIKEQQRAEKEKRKLEEATEKARLRQEKEEKRRSTEVGGQHSKFSLLHRKAAAPTAAGGTATVATAATPTNIVPEIVPGATVVVHDRPDLISQPSTHEYVAPGEGNLIHEQVTKPITVPGESTSLVPDDSVEPTQVWQRPSTELEAAARPSTEISESGKSLDTGDESDTANTPGKTAKPSKVKSWMKGRFRAKSNAAAGEEMPVVPEGAEDAPVGATPIVGTSSTTKKAPSEGSMRDVAMAGRASTGTKESEDLYGAGQPVSPPITTANTATAASRADRSPSISSVSSAEDVRTKPATSTFAPISTDNTTTAATTTATRASMDQSTDDERGRRGFKDRLLSKLPGRHQNQQHKPGDPTPMPVTVPTPFGTGIVVAEPTSSNAATSTKALGTVPVTTSSSNSAGLNAYESVTSSSSRPVPTSGLSANPNTNLSEDEGEFVEARDHFDEPAVGSSSLAAVPETTATTAAARAKTARAGESRFHEEL